MRILYVSPDYPRPDSGSNIYTDLAVALKNNDHTVKVIVSEEKKKIDQTKEFKERELPVLRVRTGNMYEVGFVEKTLTFLNVSKELIKAIKEYYSNDKFDLILFSSPPATLHKVVKWAMKKYKCPSYLMMKDIFPQNGADIGLYKRFSPIYIFFRRHEKKLYKTSTVIGCMSPGNVEYIKEHNRYLKKKQIELFPNTIEIKDKDKLSIEEKAAIRKKYGCQKTDVIALYGGNFGKPQGLDFLPEIFETYKHKKNLKFILIGRGTEKERLFKIIKERNYHNVITYDYIPREEYEKLTAVCDIGLIFLDKRFTIPNYPSRTLSYVESSLPIMAAIDLNTDYGKTLEKFKIGYRVENGNIKAFKKYFDKLVDDHKLRREMGKNARKYFEQECDVKKTVRILEKFIEQKKEKKQ